MIVIPMAGLSQRFRNDGYSLPKYMLALHGKSLFAHTVGSFKNFFETELFLFIARAENNTHEFIAHESKALGIRRTDILILPHETKGQADTVRLGLCQKNILMDEPVTIFNIDTIRPNFQFPDRDWMSHADGYLEVMPSHDPGFSYVLPQTGKEEKVACTAEKQVISNLASTGIYYFKDASRFLESFSEEVSSPSSSEIYIAPLYNHMIRKGLDIRYHEIREDQVFYSGTPSQYKDLLSRSTLI